MKETYKRLILGLTLAVLPALGVYAVERTGRQNENVVTNTGDTILYFKVSIPAAAPAVIVSSYSSTKALLTCKNVGTSSVWLGADATIFKTSATVYEVQAATWGATSVYQSNSMAQVYGIGNTGGTTLNCTEER